VLLNTKGYWDPMLTMLERGFEQGFIQSHYRGIYTVANTPEEAIEHVIHARTSDPTPSHESLRDERGGGTA
jgi:predicted Rossmann-fold nucleotide-binding protein